MGLNEKQRIAHKLNARNYRIRKKQKKLEMEEKIKSLEFQNELLIKLFLNSLFLPTP